MKTSFVLGLVIVAFAFVSNGADALPRGSELMKPKRFTVDSPVSYDYNDDADTSITSSDVDAISSQKMSCVALIETIIQFIQNLLGRSDGSLSVGSIMGTDDLIRDIFQGYNVLLNPNTKEPLKFVNIFSKLAKVITIIIQKIEEQLQRPKPAKNPIVTPIASTAERIEEDD